eukprot:14769372-Alexandrium_andersonii.AAC.1
MQQRPKGAPPPQQGAAASPPQASSPQGADPPEPLASPIAPGPIRPELGAGGAACEGFQNGARRRRRGHGAANG